MTTVGPTNRTLTHIPGVCSSSTRWDPARSVCVATLGGDGPAPTGPPCFTLSPTVPPVPHPQPHRTSPFSTLPCPYVDSTGQPSLCHPRMMCVTIQIWAAYYITMYRHISGLGDNDEG